VKNGADSKKKKYSSINIATILIKWHIISFFNVDECTSGIRFSTFDSMREVER
jgi:hypothetical protein